MSKKIPAVLRVFFFVAIALLTVNARAEVILQYFQTDWDEIYRRLPEISEMGYSGLWIPPSSKSPVAGGLFAGGGNVGYSLYDRFDIGDVPQRGSIGTAYGTRGSLRNLSDNAHQSNVKIYPDIVFNHSGNGPDIRTYPGTRVNDYHGWIDGSQPGGFRRATRMNDYDDINNGDGYTFQEELAGLFDLQTERDQRFVTGYSQFSAPPAAYVRQPGWDERYPFNGGTNVAETTVDFMYRWINWLSYAIDADGARLDAAKHVVADFYGWPGYDGFTHQIQWNFDNRRGYSDTNEYDQMYENYIRRDDALIFAENFVGGVSQVDYWRVNSNVKMRYIDFPRKSSMIDPAFSGGTLGSLADLNANDGFSDTEGVLWCQSHDTDPPSKNELAYAYILTHVGLPVVYFTGNNLAGGDVNVKTWLKTGYSGALGDNGNNAVPNLVYIHNQFARGREWTRWNENDFYAYERYDDLNSNANPDTGEGLLLVGLNDSGSWQTRNGVQTAFDSGTVLHDYTGNNGSDLTVDGTGKVNLSIPPGNNGQGWVCYAPYNASANGEPIRLSVSGVPVGTMAWVVPGGTLATNKLRLLPRVTTSNVDIDVYYTDPPGSYVDSVMVEWGQGTQVSTNYYDAGNSIVSGGFQSAVSNSGFWRLSATLTNVPDGLNLISARAFTHRTAGHPALFQTFTKCIYVDQHGPDIQMPVPYEGQTIEGGITALITNMDRTAYQVSVGFDGGVTNAAYEFMKGSWRYAIPVLSSGTHTMLVTATEADWGDPRSVINTSTLVRTFNVVTNGPSLAIGYADGATISLPFFTTTITAPGVNQDQVKLYWDGFQMAGLTGTGTITHVFDGRYVSGGVTDRLWGAFVNGPHIFDVVAASGGVTSRLSREVVFNLYGNNQIDSDGDGLSDDIEMPNFDQGTAPGPNVPWPGDTSSQGNQDMIPNYGETWTRLNPMNADTTYNGVWDGDEDWDNDGYNNLCEVRQGFLEFGDPYHYNIYNAGSHPTVCDSQPLNSQVSWTPASPTRCPGNTLSITYTANGGVLSNSSPVYIHIGYDNWTNVIDPAMTSIGGGAWQYAFNIPTNATDIEFVFHDAASNFWDGNSGNNWTSYVGACVVTTNYFNMDGLFDSPNYLVASSGMKILAAVKGDNLYVATWSPAGNDSGDDHFLYVTDKFSPPQPSPWAKAGNVYFDLSSKPYISAESKVTNGFVAFNNGGASARVAEGSSGNALEGEINLVQVFGYMPTNVYIAAVAMGDNDGGNIDSQCPPAYGDNSNDLETTEFLPVPVASIRDEDLDGVFDIGKPQMWTMVNGNTNDLRDANYDLRRIFLDELMDDYVDLTVVVQPNAPGGTNVLSNVELFTDVNRRDFAVLPGDEDPDTVTTSSQTTYYRAYTMTNDGTGRFYATVRVNKCGVYRVNARYKINGGSYIYYSDGGLRRDCAVVVSPKKALSLVMYELNPMVIEATNNAFDGRSTFKDMYTANTNKPDIVNLNHFPGLGVNMVWLQPIHPIGTDNRQTDPSTGQPYDPGSPYAVKNYWKVNTVLGDPAADDEAMSEFTNFVQQMDSTGVGVMLDGTFNHSAWDCQIGDVGVQMFPWATNATDLIRNIRPEWYSKKGDYGQHATYYNNAADNDIAQAPDRFDFGKWSDVADFFFGTYDSLVQGQTDEWRDQYLAERDEFDGFGTNIYTRELWQYFAYYPIYWLDKTGCPAGTPKTQSYKGIDGLRCDFAQGLPSPFWEYCINKTRSVKWDFIFMAESLDGYRTVNGSNRHGLSYRSARQFDVLNENMVFYWRDQFFAYPANGPGSAGTPNPTTAPTYNAFNDRKNAYDVAPILLNLTSHDEVYPADDPYRTLYGYFEESAMDGVPFMFYGQEAGAQNSKDAYGFNGGITNYDHNFSNYETNFGKAIVNFKRYNTMTNIWAPAHRDWNLQGIYGRINHARQNSTALRSQQNYFLSQTNGAGYDPDILAVAKFSQAGVSAASQEVVLCFVNNNFVGSTNRFGAFSLNATIGGSNWFGIDPTHQYNIVDLVATNPAAYIWSPDKSGSELINTGIVVILNGNPYDGKQAQFLRLVDKTVNPSGLLPDSDGDGIPDYLDPDNNNNGIPDWWETQHFGCPTCCVATADSDGDGVDNYDEYLAGTDPNDARSVLDIRQLSMTGTAVGVTWDSVQERNYRVQKSVGVAGGNVNWQDVSALRTALSTNETENTSAQPSDTNQFYRVLVQP